MDDAPESAQYYLRFEVAYDAKQQGKSLNLLGASTAFWIDRQSEPPGKPGDAASLLSPLSGWTLPLIIFSAFL